MFDMGQFSNFHFLRPQWLLTLLPVFLLSGLLLRKQSAARQWKKYIASHLLQHLVVGTAQKKRVRPVNLLLPVFILAALALAGPSWLQEPLPFTEDEAPLIIALDLSFEMNTMDIQPSRLERAKQKVRDLLAERAGARTALIGYAGSAHMILPLTDDAQILELYLDSLSPEIMPDQGKNAAEALALAEKLLAQEQAPGTILFMTNAVGGEAQVDLVAHKEESANAVMILGFGTALGGPIPIGRNRFRTDLNGSRVISTLDREGLAALSQDAGIYVTSVTVDDSDVRRINSRVKRHLSEMLTEDENTRWKDFGYVLVFPIAFLALFWYRRGWTIQWLSGFILVVLLFQPAPIEAKTHGFLNLWLTADQQGRYQFEKGNYAEAALCFEDPLWKGVAFYYAEDYESAIQQFSRLETAESYFNLGNAFAHLGDLDQAVTSYEHALEIEPDSNEAEQNRKLIQALLDKQAEDKEEERRSEPGSQLGADEIRIADPDDPTKREETEGEPIEIKQEMYSDEQLNEMWMRRVQTSPADFLRIKFAFQLQTKEREKSQDGERQER
jgi:Ca-activated chloride channel family protein